MDKTKIIGINTTTIITMHGTHIMEESEMNSRYIPNASSF